MFKELLLKIKENFLYFVPPPEFLRMSHVGLNVSDHSIKILELKRGRGGYKLSYFNDEPIAEGIIKSGNINDRDALREAFQRIKKKYNLSFVGVTLPEEKAYVFRLKVPKTTNDKEIRSNIEFQLEDNVPLSINEALFDYEVIPQDSDRQHMYVSVHVLPQKVVASYVSLLKDVGITPLYFEIEADSIARSVIKRNDPSTFMLVDYGRTRTGFSVVGRGVVRYTSTAEIGGDSITKIIMDQFKVSAKEAEKIKNEKGLFRDEENPELYMSLANAVSVLRDEINKRFIFWHTHKVEGKEDPIKEIILVGGNSNIFGLEEYLSSSLKVKVERANI